MGGHIQQFVGQMEASAVVGVVDVTDVTDDVAVVGAVTVVDVTVVLMQVKVPLMNESKSLLSRATVSEHAVGSAGAMVVDVGRAGFSPDGTSVGFGGGNAGVALGLAAVGAGAGFGMGSSPAEDSSVGNAVTVAVDVKGSSTSPTQEHSPRILKNETPAASHVCCVKSTPQRLAAARPRPLVRLLGTQLMSPTSCRARRPGTARRPASSDKVVMIIPLPSKLHVRSPGRPPSRSATIRFKSAVVCSHDRSDGAIRTSKASRSLFTHDRSVPDGSES